MITSRNVAALFVSLALPLAVGCSKSEPAPAPISAEARETFKNACAVCHGESGKGDGVGAGALNPKPRNYTDAAWQASVTDEQIKKVIMYGGAAVGKSPIMPATPGLDAKPELVNGLVSIVRSFKGK